MSVTYEQVGWKLYPNLRVFLGGFYPWRQLQLVGFHYTRWLQAWPRNGHRRAVVWLRFGNVRFPGEWIENPETGPVRREPVCVDCDGAGFDAEADCPSCCGSGRAA